MRRAIHIDPCAGERGITLIEVLIALVVLSVGIMAIGGIFPAATRTQLQTRSLGAASYFAAQKAEQLGVLNWDDPNLTTGRHPAGSVCDTLGATKAWTRFYVVEAMAAPLDDLKRVSITVNWTYNGTRSVVDTIYVRKS
jgi:prepilin-type N-terminal cleavage/methylation domain-containing protein